MNRSTKRWALFLACIVVLTFIVVVGRTESGKANTKTSWEYKVVKELSAADPERSLNQLGTEGWELVYFMHTDGLSELTGTWVFKRLK